MKISHRFINVSFCILMMMMMIVANKNISSQVYHQFSASKITYTENPSGMGLGFWANYSKHDVVLKNFGKRSMGRVDFQGWDSYELTKGIYNWGNFSNYKRSHIFGEDPIGCINISFTEQVGPKTTIPTFYYPRIINAETRQAAKNFLYAFTQELVNQCGTMMLSIDYEINYNYGLYKNDTQVGAWADEWGAWYVEAAAVVRQACSDMGKSGAIKLVPITNGDPLNTALYNRGVAANQWLKNVVNASDFLGVDSYQWKPGIPVTNPTYTLQILNYWIKNFSGTKKVIICENGFTSVTTNAPTIYAGSKDGKEKYGGTEEQQRIYFKSILDSLKLYNQTGGYFQNKLKGYNLWCITDNVRPGKEGWEVFFGLIRDDGTAKPALNEVKAAYKSFETDAFHRPRVSSNVEDITTLINNQSISTSYSSGDNHQSVKCILPTVNSFTTFILTTKTQSNGGVLVCINDSNWLYKDAVGKNFSFDLKNYIIQGVDNTVELFFTGEKYPFSQQINEINFSYTPHILSISSLKTSNNNIFRTYLDPINNNLEIVFIQQGSYNVSVYNMQGVKSNYFEVDGDKLSFGSESLKNSPAIINVTNNESGVSSSLKVNTNF